MESFPAQRFETKIEAFDPCIIDVQANHQRDSIAQDVVQQSQSQPISQIEGQENHESSNVQHSEQMPQVAVANVQNNMNLTPVRLPAILDGEFFSVVRVEDTNVTVRCMQCQKLLNGNLKSTGNFLCHIKRVHSVLIDKIKCKSNQRKPAMVYIDMSGADKCAEIVRTKRGYRKCYRAEDPLPANDEPVEQNTVDWSESPVARRRRSDEPESNDILKFPHNNSFVVEDEFDAIGRNVAAKLRNMRIDQRIIAEKLLNDILFEAQLGNLQRESSVQV